MKRKRVDFDRNPDDFACYLLGECGFSNDFISRKTSLTTGQINYRLRLTGTKRLDFRNGKTGISRLVVSFANGQVSAMLRKPKRKVG